LSRFHQLDLEALRFQQLVQRDPVDAGRFHGDCFHAAFLQPRDDLVKIGGVGTELPDRVGIAVRWDADHMHVGMNVDPSRVGIEEVEWRRRSGDGDGQRPLTRLLGLG
jgi:hypothetical protein